MPEDAKDSRPRIWWTPVHKILKNLCSKVLTVTTENAYEWNIRREVRIEGIPVGNRLEILDNLVVSRFLSLTRRGSEVALQPWRIAEAKQVFAVIQAA